MDQAGFNKILRENFEDSDRARTDLEAYFSTSGRRFTGSQFERMRDTAHPDVITAQDILAVSTLSVEIPVGAALWILGEEGSSRITELLSDVRPYVEIWDDDAARLLAEGGPLWRLWDLLAAAHWPATSPVNQMGRTKISKLIATKRPKLSPILDSVITETYFPGVSRYWDAFRAALCDEELRTLLTSATESPGVHDDVSLLRRIDAVLWFRDWDSRHLDAEKGSSA